MMVQLSCETCWFDFTIPEERLGQITNCPNCGARVFPEVDLRPVGIGPGGAEGGSRSRRGRRFRPTQFHPLSY